jgi:hypothetical protein
VRMPPRASRKQPTSVLGERGRRGESLKCTKVCPVERVEVRLRASCLDEGPFGTAEPGVQSPSKSYGHQGPHELSALR